MPSRAVDIVTDAGKNLDCHFPATTGDSVDALPTVRGMALVEGAGPCVLDRHSQPIVFRLPRSSAGTGSPADLEQLPTVVEGRRALPAALALPGMQKKSAFGGQNYGRSVEFARLAV